MIKDSTIWCIHKENATCFQSVIYCTLETQASPSGRPQRRLVALSAVEASVTIPGFRFAFVTVALLKLISPKDISIGE